MIIRVCQFTRENVHELPRNIGAVTAPLHITCSSFEFYLIVVPPSNEAAKANNQAHEKDDDANETRLQLSLKKGGLDVNRTLISKARVNHQHTGDGKDCGDNHRGSLDVESL